MDTVAHRRIVPFIERLERLAHGLSLFAFVRLDMDLQAPVDARQHHHATRQWRYRPSPLLVRCILAEGNQHRGSASIRAATYLVERMSRKKRRAPLWRCLSPALNRGRRCSALDPSHVVYTAILSLCRPCAIVVTTYSCDFTGDAVGPYPDHLAGDVNAAGRLDSSSLGTVLGHRGCSLRLVGKAPRHTQVARPLGLPATMPTFEFGLTNLAHIGTRVAQVVALRHVIAEM